MGMDMAVLARPGLFGGGPRNTAAPAISATAVIGTLIEPTPGTWTGSPVLTYQWQRYTSGAWVDISGATAIDRAPVDADFGLALRLAEIPNGNAANAVYSNSTGLTAEAPAQTLGAELLTNGTFTDWTLDDPDGWTVGGESGSDPVVTQVDPGGGVGTGAAKLYSSATPNVPTLRQNVFEVGGYFESQALVSAYASGLLEILDAAAGYRSASINAVGTLLYLARATNTGAILRVRTAPSDLALNSASIKKLTLNGQLVAPSADMQLDQLYTLPVSPVMGTQATLFPRVSDFAAGNFWQIDLIYTGTQWNITLWSVATFTKTSRIAATDIGASDGIRINMNGDQISLYSTANGGTDWTQHGSTITNNTYQAATGVNVMWTSNVTIGNLTYAAAT